MDTPFFSIIVVAFNAAKTIRTTVDSVLAQSFQDYEIIVKDACSDDGTLEQVPEDPRIRVYSTKDKGIYDGMNEAVGYARGEYVQFLNCGDLFYDSEVLRKVWETARDLTAPSVVYGDHSRAGVHYKQATNYPSTSTGHPFATKRSSSIGLCLLSRLMIFSIRSWQIMTSPCGISLRGCPSSMCRTLSATIWAAVSPNLPSGSAKNTRRPMPSTQSITPEKSGPFLTLRSPSPCGGSGSL